MAAPGQTFTTGEQVPESAVYTVIDHPQDGDCRTGRAVALAAGDPFPTDPGCGQPAHWQLTHLAPSAAAIEGDAPNASPVDTQRSTGVSNTS